MPRLELYQDIVTIVGFLLNGLFWWLQTARGHLVAFCNPPHQLVKLIFDIMPECLQSAL